MQLEGKVVLVTGAGSGIGAAIAASAAGEGAHVMIADVTGESADEVARGLAGVGPGARWVEADVSPPDGARTAVGTTIDAFSRIDVLVNNAGIVRDAQLINMEPEAWDAVLGVNLTGTYLMCRAAAEHMVCRGQGRIINIASRSLLGNFGQTNYAASKAGVVGLTKSLALELGPAGVNVNAIAPGYIETPIMSNVPDEVRERAIRAAPLRRVGTPEDVAAVVVFLASEESSYITGQCIFVCGGRSLAAALEMWV